MNPPDLAGYTPTGSLLRDRVILVTGAAVGIGRMAALEYARLGATVILLDKAVKHLESLYDEIADAGYPEPALYPMDLSGALAEHYDQMADKLESEFGRLDGLLVNAAVVGGLSPVRGHDLKRWMQAISVNLHAPFLLCHALLPLMDASSDPAILFSTDHVRRAHWGGYACAKAGLNVLLDILAQELEGGTRPVRVNGIDTGPVRTGMRTENFPGVPPSTWVLPETYLKHYVYLMGPDSRGISGQNWRLASA